MLNENAIAWIKALRSGDYQQGQGRLAGEGRYCCLGVACELAVAAGVTQAALVDDAAVSGTKEYDGHRGSLPYQVQAWLGLASDNGAHMGTHGGQCLSSLNDDNRWDFGRIADLIESEPAGLFAEFPAGAVGEPEGR